MALIQNVDQVIWFILVLFLTVLFALTVMLVCFAVKNRRNNKLVTPDGRSHYFYEIMWIITPTLITLFMFYIGYSSCF
jgi:heme/copper-type cytochrome/quinol oxidase subunit 2